MRPHSPSRPVRLAVLLAATSLLAAACSSAASTRGADEPSPSTTGTPSSVTTQPDAAGDETEPATVSTDPPPVTAPAVPDGVTLRLGDQFDYLQTVLELGGQDQDFPYDVQYSTFVGGPAMLEAFNAGELDAGFIGTTPLIFAQAAGLDLIGIGGWASSERSAYTLVTAPGVTGISDWGDLAGRSVAYQRGTAGEAVLLQALDRAGLSLSDVTPVDVSQIAVSATLEGGSADAGIQIEPLTSAFIANNPDATVVASAAELTDRTSILVSTAAALDDDGTAAALADYLVRIERSFEYLRTHQEELAQGVYVEIYGLTPERALELVQENGETRLYAIPGELLAAQQRLADLFFAADQIPARLDVAAQFDPRFNELVLATQAAADGGR